jgi:CBS domain-containing protein
MASGTIIQDVYEFLKKYPPFDLIETSDLKKLASTVSMQYYEEGEVITAQNAMTYNYFFMVNKGSVQIIEKREDKDILIDKCDEGDIFGVRTAMTKSKYPASAIASEESLLYTFEMAFFNKLLETNPKLSLFFAMGFASRISNMKNENGQNIQNQRNILKQFKDQSVEKHWEIDALKVDQLKLIITCTPTHTIQQAAQMMATHNINTIIITNETRKPLGIITDSDFRRKVVAKEDIIKTKPVTAIMSSPVKTIKADISVAEIMLKMVSHRVNNLVVTEDGTPETPVISVVSQRDVLIAQGNNPAVIAKHILKAESVEELQSLRNKVEHFTQSYLDQDINIAFVANVVSEINDLLVQKIISLAIQSLEEQNFPQPHLQFCWLALGSEGRKEQMLRTDQDNALIYENPALGEQETAHVYFVMLAEKVNQMLVFCGFAECKLGLTAQNPQWCQSIAVWKTYFEQWIHLNDPNELIHQTIFFDFRPVAGDFSMADDLKQFIFEQIENQPSFLSIFAKAVLKSPPPLSFFRDYVVEKTGKYKDQFDIKTRAMMPLINAARVLMYDFKIKNYLSTMERFEAIAQLDEVLKPVCEASAMAFEILLRRRTVNGLTNKNNGQFINPNDFNKLERQIVRNTFKTIEQIQQILASRYR